MRQLTFANKLNPFQNFIEIYQATIFVNYLIFKIIIHRLFDTIYITRK